MRMRVQSLTSLSELRIWHCHKLLWLWYRLAVAALIGPLAWEPPYAAGTALKSAHTDTHTHTDTQTHTHTHTKIEVGLKKQHPSIYYLQENLL